MRAITLRDLEDLGWRRFEDLVFALVLEESPGAEKLASPDGGADVLFEGRAGEAKVWQVKHFPRRIHWEQCIESLDAAVDQHGATEVVFVFPRDMGKTVRKSFKEKLRERHAGVSVSYLSGSQVIAMLREREGRFITEFFGPDPRDQARAVADHLATRGLQVSKRPPNDWISHRLQLADEASRRDRYFRTEISVTTGDAPVSSWAEEPTYLLTTTESDRELRIAAWPEKARNEALVDFFLDEGEEEREARREIAMMLARDGEAKLPKGATARLRKVPEAIRALAPGKGDVIEDITLKPVRAHPVRLGGEWEGGRVERTMEVVPVPLQQDPQPGTRVFEFGCLDGELSLFLGFALKGEEVAVEFRLSLALLDPAKRGGVVEALRLLAALDQGTGHWEAPTLFPLGPAPLKESASEERINRTLSALRFFESLEAIEELPDVDPFQLETEVTPEENDVAQMAAEVLETRSGHYEFSSLGGLMPVQEAERVRRGRGEGLVARFPVSVEVLGNEVHLGIGEAELPKPDGISVSAASQPSKSVVELHWDSMARVSFRVVGEPGSRSVETGLWVAGEAPRLPQ